MKKKRTPKNTLVIVPVALDMANDELLDLMRGMKHSREIRCEHVVCLISGFGDDKREMYLIPEARAFCKRLVDQGFISYLDYATSIVDDGTAGSWGAFEVWVCSKGKYGGKGTDVTDWLVEFNNVLGESNSKADALLGPIVLK